MQFISFAGAVIMIMFLCTDPVLTRSAELYDFTAVLFGCEQL